MSRQQNYTSGRDRPSRRRSKRRVGGIAGEPETNMLPPSFVIIVMRQIVIMGSHSVTWILFG